MSAPTSAVVRPMRWTDLPAVSALEARLFPEDAWSTGSWWAELAGRPRRDYVVLGDSAGTVLGYAGLDLAPDVADVMTVAVDPDRQGAGLGRLLLGALVDRATVQGVRSLMLEVRADNAPAIRLYERHGFVPVHTRRGYYPGGVDALVMRRDVTRQGTGVLPGEVSVDG